MYQLSKLSVSSIARRYFAAFGPTPAFAEDEVDEESTTSSSAAGKSAASRYLLFSVYQKSSIISVFSSNTVAVKCDLLVLLKWNSQISCLREGAPLYSVPVGNNSSRPPSLDSLFLFPHKRKH